MNKFTIPCDFRGTKHPYDIYAGEPADEDHPLRLQTAWLKEVCGGFVPQDVANSFEQLLASPEELRFFRRSLCLRPQCGE